MNTRNKVKRKAQELFNLQGVQNITLRHIAQELNISYGNVTYHFPNKTKLLEVLYEDMNQQLMKLSSRYQEGDNLLAYFLQLPDDNFDITLDYIFFYKDFVELKRNYPEFYQKVEAANLFRKGKWMEMMFFLQHQGFLKAELTEKDLNYIIELSVGIRMFYFQDSDLKQIRKSIFKEKVNRLLLPYLSEKGILTYTEVCNLIE